MAAHPVELPALDGRQPLGFLAALGLLRLVTNERGPATTLAWSERTGCALLHSDLADVNAIVDVLANVAARIPEGGALPDVDPRFPLAKQGSGVDPMRVGQAECRRLAQEAAAIAGADVTDVWIPCVLTDLAVDQKRRAALSPLMAPSGQQSVRTFFQKAADLVRSDHRFIKEALVLWQRVDDYSGEYLDHRVLRSAADHPSGESTEAGVPGATWLATQALPLLRVSGTGGSQRAATLWHMVGGRAVMVWPLWSQPLDAHAVMCLLEHPVFDVNPPPREDLAVLGAFDVVSAVRERIPGRKAEGVLVPTKGPFALSTARRDSLRRTSR